MSCAVGRIGCVASLSRAPVQGWIRTVEPTTYLLPDTDLGIVVVHCASWMTRISHSEVRYIYIQADLE